jgi:hypothetical protein
MLDSNIYLGARTEAGLVSFALRKLKSVAAVGWRISVI